MKGWHAIALLVIVVAVAYYPVIAAPFNPLDDLRMVNDLLDRQPSLAALLLHPAGSYFRPLVLASWLADQALWGLEPSFMHLENLLLHIVNVLLVFFLARFLFQRHLAPHTALQAAFSAALLFGLHPLNSEAVNWIAGRADLLAGTFGLLTLLLLLAWLAIPRWHMLLLAMAAFTLGSLSKETVLFLLPAIFYAVFFHAVAPPEGQLTLRHKFICAIGFILLVGGYFLVRHQVLSVADYGLQHTAQLVGGGAPAGGASVVPATTPDSRPWAGTFWHLLAVTGFYCGKLLFPWPLNYGIIEVADSWAWLGLCVLGLSVWCIWCRRWPVVFWLAALGGIAAALLVALGQISWTPVAERYMYLPCAMAALLVVHGATLLPGIGGMAISVPFACVLVFCGWSVFQRALIWQDNVRLYQDTLAKSPGFAMARNQLAAAWLLRGETGKAMALYEGLVIPDNQVASLNPALAMAERGDLAGAREFLRERLATPYTFEVEILRRLVSVVERMIAVTDDVATKNTLYQEGLGYLNRLYDLTHDPFYWYRIGQFQMAVGDRETARLSFQRAFRALPDDSPYKEPSRKLAAAMSQ